MAHTDPANRLLAGEINNRELHALQRERRRSYRFVYIGIYNIFQPLHVQARRTRSGFEITRNPQFELSISSGFKVEGAGWSFLF